MKVFTAIAVLILVFSSAFYITELVKERNNIQEEVEMLSRYYEAKLEYYELKLNYDFDDVSEDFLMFLADNYSEVYVYFAEKEVE